MKLKSYLYTVCILLSGIFWGVMGIFVRAISKYGFNPFQITTVRLISGVLFLALFTLISDIKLFRISPKDILIFAVIGIFSILTMSWLYFEAITRTSLAIAGILLYTAPIWVLIFSVTVYKEKLTIPKIIALVLAFTGCILISGTGGKVSGFGILCGLGSGIAYALYTIIGKYVLSKYKPLTVTLYSFIFAALGTVIFCSPVKTTSLFLQAFDLKFLLIILGFGFVTVFLSFFLYTLGLSNIPAGKASIMASSDPLTSTVSGIIFFSEIPTIFGFMGIAMILAAIIILNIRNSDKA